MESYEETERESMDRRYKSSIPANLQATRQHQYEVGQFSQQSSVYVAPRCKYILIPLLKPSLIEPCLFYKLNGFV